MMSDNLHTTAQSGTTLSIKQVPIGNAWAWIVSGFYLFKANPLMWIILFVIYLAIIVPISLIPVVGSILSTLLAPVFAAGLMWGCKAVAEQQDLEINHLFAGFKQNTAQLIAVGGAYMVGLLLIAVMVVLALDKETIDVLMLGKTVSPEQASTMLLPMLVAMLFLLPLLMAYWFAPVLVGLNHLSAKQAMLLSFIACLRNILPFLLYGLIFMLLLMLAIIPFGLGLLLVVPMMMTSLYTSYVDVFSIAPSESESTE
jgi:uncharacterized membrane protein